MTALDSCRDGGIIGILLIPVVLLGAVFIFMGPAGIETWLIPVAGCIVLIVISAGSWMVAYEYRLKINAESRVQDAAVVESNVRLLKLFSEILKVAHEQFVSEKTIEGLFSNNIITSSDSPDQIRTKLDTAVIRPRIGTATQDAAIAAIYTLGKNHRDILLDPAIAGMTAIIGSLEKDGRPAGTATAKKYLDELKGLRITPGSIPEDMPGIIFGFSPLGLIQAFIGLILIVTGLGNSLGSLSSGLVVIGAGIVILFAVFLERSTR